MRLKIEKRLREHVENLSQAEKVNLVGSIIPEFQETLSTLRLVQLKYSTLTSRLSTPANS